MSLCSWIDAPRIFHAPLRVLSLSFPTYRLVVLAIAIVVALLLYLLIERTRLGAMIRAGVDDMPMARAAGIPASRLFTTVSAWAPPWRDWAARWAGRSSMPIPAWTPRCCRSP